MNLAALRHIVENNPELIEENVPERGNSAATIGVAKLLVGNNGNVAALSENQRYHYETYIRPLVESVPCDGIFSADAEGEHDGCIGNGIIDDDDLEGCYILDEMLCQECQSLQARMDADD
ncbi:hypothetical protein [Pseudomonas sp. MRSN 12121]|uniref:hypothetical protein n=1 Tax=Pseudomonas sp. MRSN 12121 TaxID=1611770 RepID=UPI0005BEABC0|nr:hypothetical protein [Pseudomonas sp. MRSN 12121]AJO77494.1 hypothetical protein TO66_09340 [Pseudomonas sp. MRSN 12121]